MDLHTQNKKFAAHRQKHDYGHNDTSYSSEATRPNKSSKHAKSRGQAVSNRSRSPILQRGSNIGNDMNNNSKDTAKISYQLKVLTQSHSSTANSEMLEQNMTRKETEANKWI